jgi:HprK-related kinase A
VTPATSRAAPERSETVVHGSPPWVDALEPRGIAIDHGLVRSRVRTDQPLLTRHLAQVYRHAAPQPADSWCDVDAAIWRARGLRRWLQPQVRFVADGRQAFEPFAAGHALPLLEWGLNWRIGRCMNDVLLLHAGVLERDGNALVMPALPGSGKSTLTAALSLHGWRLLSDEFGAFDPATGAFRAVLKPVALKNESIDVIARLAPTAELGPRFAGTRKGTVAHLAPPLEAWHRLHEPARPGALLLPRWQAGSETLIEPIDASTAFSSLAFNAFNYTVLGATGFSAVCTLIDSMPAWRLVYGNLEDALGRLLDWWHDQVPAGSGRG